MRDETGCSLFRAIPVEAGPGDHSGRAGERVRGLSAEHAASRRRAGDDAVAERDRGPERRAVGRRAPRAHAPDAQGAAREPGRARRGEARSLAAPGRIAHRDRRSFRRGPSRSRRGAAGAPPSRSSTPRPRQSRVPSRVRRRWRRLRRLRRPRCPVFRRPAPRPRRPQAPALRSAVRRAGCPDRHRIAAACRSSAPGAVPPPALRPRFRR